QELEFLVPELLASEDATLRTCGVALAAVILDEATLEPLLTKQLADTSAEVRLEATANLADFAEPHLRPALAAALQDEDFGVRFEAARGMAALRHSAGLDVLLEALNES